MTQKFIKSAKQRASQKGMDIEVYLAEQIRLSANALETVRSEREYSSREQLAVDFDVREIGDTAERMKKHLTAESEA